MRGGAEQQVPDLVSDHPPEERRPVDAETTEERAVIQTRLVTVQAQVPEAERRLSRARERYEDYLYEVRLSAGQAYAAPQSPAGNVVPTPPYAMTPAFDPPYRTRPAAVY